MPEPSDQRPESPDAPAGTTVGPAVGGEPESTGSSAELSGPSESSGPSQESRPEARPVPGSRIGTAGASRPEHTTRGPASTAVRRVRDLLASMVLTVAVLAAAALALGAVLTALGANPKNSIVSTVLDLAHRLDGPFVNMFTFADDLSKQLLVNWGIAAIAYLILGRILERVLRP